MTSFEKVVWTNINLLQSHLNFLSVLSVLCLLNVTSLSRSKVDNTFHHIVASMVTSLQNEKKSSVKYNLLTQSSVRQQSSA